MWYFWFQCLMQKCIINLDISVDLSWKIPKACVLSQYVVNYCLWHQYITVKKHINVPMSKTTLHNWIQEPKQDDGSSGFVYKLYIIKGSHPYLYYPSSFRKGFSPIIMRFSVHLCICFQLRHWEQSLSRPSSHGYSSLSSLIPSSVPGRSP